MKRGSFKNLVGAVEFVDAVVVGVEVVDAVEGGGGAARFFPPVEHRGDVDEEEEPCITV